MLDYTPPTWHVMQRMNVTYDAATSALGTSVPVSTIEAATEGRFVVESVQHALPGAVQGFVGRLRCGALPWQQVPGELAVEPWSYRESAVTLRPSGRPPRARAERYFGTALSVVGAVRGELLASGARDAVRQVEELRKAS
jgi:hypothetical protein